MDFTDEFYPDASPGFGQRICCPNHVADQFRLLFLSVVQNLFLFVKCAFGDAVVLQLICPKY